LAKKNNDGQEEEVGGGKNADARTLTRYRRLKKKRNVSPNEGYFQLKVST